MDLKMLHSDFVRLARKHDLTIAQVKLIYSYQFKLIMNKIHEDFEKPIEERDDIKMRGLGTLKFNPYLAKRITEKKQEKYEREILRVKKASEDGDRTQPNQNND
jgi:undecaprenyl pyrophosphate synthase